MQMEELLGRHTVTRHHSERGELMSNIGTSVRHASATCVVQRYGRLYVLQIVRWLAALISGISQDASYKCQIEGFAGLDEPFKLFLNEDKYFVKA